VPSVRGTRRRGLRRAGFELKLTRPLTAAHLRQHRLHGAALKSRADSERFAWVTRHGLPQLAAGVCAARAGGPTRLLAAMHVQHPSPGRSSGKSGAVPPVPCRHALCRQSRRAGRPGLALIERFGGDPEAVLKSRHLPDYGPAPPSRTTTSRRPLVSARGMVTDRRAQTVHGHASPPFGVQIGDQRRSISFQSANRLHLL
jgi:hypothetical protein